MRSFTLKLSLESDVYQRENGEMALRSTLYKIADDIGSWAFDSSRDVSQRIKDDNGNTVGGWELKGE
jgi:hypothetical protein